MSKSILSWIDGYALKYSLPAFTEYTRQIGHNSDFLTAIPASPSRLRHRVFLGNEVDKAKAKLEYEV